MPKSRSGMEDFRGDYQNLATLLQSSWGDNSAQGLSYSAEFLESFLTSPGFSNSLAPSIYKDSVPVGFASGFRRTVEYRGRSLQLMTSSFLSVASEYKKFGLGVLLWSELVKRARHDGFDGMLNFCVDGEPMNSMIEGCCHRLRLGVHRIFSVRHMSTLLKAGDAAEFSETGQNANVNTFLRLAAPLVSTQPLTRKWSAPEAEWQCLRRFEHVFTQATYGAREGILTGYVIPILDKAKTKCLVVEDIFWDELGAAEQVDLLTRFLSQAVALGARMATVPVLGYADLTTFKKARFFPTRRVLNCYLTLFDSELPLESLPSMYMDVF